MTLSVRCRLNGLRFEVASAKFCQLKLHENFDCKNFNQGLEKLNYKNLDYEYKNCDYKNSKRLDYENQKNQEI